tara:strand:- start:132 stop:314 length:183 start_codon:yes stop_codon:yes gene_type:complete
MKDETGGLLVIAAVFTCLGAWITHIIHCLVTAKYLLLIAGGFFFPIGMIHGFGIWFGVNW